MWFKELWRRYNKFILLGFALILLISACLCSCQGLVNANGTGNEITIMKEVANNYETQKKTL